jgi:predicted nucleotidyltransferase
MQDKTSLNIKSIASCFDKYSNVKYAILFGSAIKNAKKSKDVDILVGGEIDFDEILELSIEAERILKKKVDVVSADKAPARLILRAMAKGDKILVKDDVRFKKDYFKNLRIAEDSKGLYKIREERIKRRFSDG